MIGTIADSGVREWITLLLHHNYFFSERFSGLPRKSARFLARPDPFLRNKLQHLDLE